jgi:hypothetical protein
MSDNKNRFVISFFILLIVVAFLYKFFVDKYDYTDSVMVIESTYGDSDTTPVEIEI